MLLQVIARKSAHTTQLAPLASKQYHCLEEPIEKQWNELQRQDSARADSCMDYIEVHVYVQERFLVRIVMRGRYAKLYA
jgi:hypothetical protein